MHNNFSYYSFCLLRRHTFLLHLFFSGEAQHIFAFIGVGQLVEKSTGSLFFFSPGKAAGWEGTKESGRFVFLGK